MDADQIHRLPEARPQVAALGLQIGDMLLQAPSAGAAPQTSRAGP